jgi:PAS domain S-box-containing protein
MTFSFSAMSLSAVIVLSVFLSLLTLSFWLINREDRTSLWLTAWLVVSGIFSFFRLLQFYSLNEAAHAIAARGLLTAGYCLAWMGYELCNSFTERRSTVRERVLLALVVGSFIALLWASDLILTNQEIIRKVAFSESFHGFAAGPLYLPANLLILAISFIPLTRLLRGKSFHKRENRYMALGFALIIIFSLVDFLSTNFKLAWIRFSDYSYLPIAFLFSLLQVQRFGRLYSEMNAVVQERTNELSRTNDTLQAEVAERRQVENELRKLSQAVEQSNTSIVITDISGAIEYVNPYFLNLTGYSDEEVRGKNPRILKSDLTPDSIYEELWQTIISGKEWRGEFCNKKKNGERYWESASISPVTDDSGLISHFVAVKTDITEQKRAETALRESEARYRAIKEQSLEAIYMADCQSKRLLEVNPAFLKLLGYNTEEALGLTQYDLIVQKRENIDAMNKRILAEGVVNIGERQWRRKDGSLINVEVTAGKIKREKNDMVFAVAREITERKLAEEKIRRYANEMKALHQTTHDLVIEQELPKLLRTIVERAVGLLGAAGGSLYLCEQEKRQVRCVVSYRTPQDISGTILNYGEGAAGQIAETGEALTIEDYKNWEGQLPSFSKDDYFHSMLGVPMLWKGQVEGIILIFENKHRTFVEEELQAATLFANQAAIAIENSRLFEAEQRRRNEADALAEIGRDISSTLQLDVVLERIAFYAKNLLNAETSAVFSSDLETKTLRAIAAVGPDAEQLLHTSLNMGEGIVGRIALQKSGEIVNDTASDPRAVTVEGTDEVSYEHLMGVPVLSKDKLTGLIAVWRTGQGLDFKAAELDFLSRLAGQVAVAIENARLFEAEQKRRQEADTLRQASEKITAVMNQQQVIHLILEQLSKVVSYETASIQLIREGYLEIVGGSGWKEPAGFIGLRFPIPGDSPNTTVILNRCPVVLDNAPAHYPIFEMAPHATIRSWMGVPLIVRDRVIGMVSVDHSQANFFTDADVQMASAFAGQAAIALENTRLFDETQKRLREMEGLAEIGAVLSRTLDLEPLLENILRVAIKAIPVAQRGSCLLADEADNLEIRAVWGYTDPRIRGFIFPPNNGYASLCFRERRAILVQDVKAVPNMSYSGEIAEMREVGSALAVPLVTKDQPLGVITIDTSICGNAFHEDDLQLLSALSASAALAIENARLFQNTRRRLSEIEGTHTVSTALRSARNIDEALPIILDQLLKLFDAGGATLEMADPVTGEIVNILANGAWKEITGMRTLPGLGVSGGVLATGKAYISSDVLGDGKAARPDMFAGLNAVACVPIIAHDQPIGALWIGRKTPVSEDETNLLSSIGEMVGNAIHRMMLNEQTERRANEFEALYRSARNLSAQWDLPVMMETTVSEAMELLHTSGGGIYLYDPKEGNLEVVVAKGGSMIRGTRLEIGEGMAGRVFQSKQSMIVDHYQTWKNRSTKYNNTSIGAVIEVPITFAGESIGVLSVYEEANSKRIYTEAESHLLSLFATQAAGAIHAGRLLEDLQEANTSLSQSYDTTLEGWAKALEMRDKETEGHSRRVTTLTLRLARRMGIPESEMNDIRRGVLLHDIGKMGITDYLLRKSGPLTDEEKIEMRKHPKYAYDLLHSIPYLQSALNIPYCHHERWDGTGYPRGLKGKKIPLPARIFAVVDVYDALSSDRPYRLAWDRRKVLAHIREQSGKHFDPTVVDAFLLLINDKNLAERDQM